MRKQSTGLFTVKSASTFEFRGSSPSALTTKQKDTRRCLFVLAGAEGLGLACRLGRCFCTSCRGLHRRPAPLNTLRVPRSLNHFTQCQNKNGHLSVTVFDLAGVEGLGLACRLGRCFCTSCRGLHRRPAPLNTLRVPRSLNHFTQCQNKNGHLSVTVFDLAGAEGLEPSARGFGDRCSTN